MEVVVVWAVGLLGVGTEAEVSWEVVRGAAAVVVSMEVDALAEAGAAAVVWVVELMVAEGRAAAAKVVETEAEAV